MRISKCTHFSFVYATTVNIFARNLFHVDLCIVRVTMKFYTNVMEILARNRGGIIQTWFFVCAEHNRIILH